MTLSLLSTESGRQRAVTAVLHLTQGTRLAPSLYEQRLLVRFVRGELTIDEVIARLENTEANRPLSRPDAAAPTAGLRGYHGPNAYDDTTGNFNRCF